MKKCHANVRFCKEGLVEITYSLPVGMFRETKSPQMEARKRYNTVAEHTREKKKRKKEESDLQRYVIERTN